MPPAELCPRYDTSPLKIFPVVDGFQHEGPATIANLITLPIADGAAFEAATVPALAEFDAAEPGTLSYLLCKVRFYTVSVRFRSL